MDIVGLILEVAIEGATKGRIMDRVYLTVLQMKDYLFLLLENGLLCYEKGTGIYKTTEKGLRMLAVYNDNNEHIGQSAGGRKRSVSFQKE
jgi:predicted transcriptional regulator